MNVNYNNIKDATINRMEVILDAPKFDSYSVQVIIKGIVYSANIPEEKIKDAIQDALKKGFTEPTKKAINIQKFIKYVNNNYNVNILSIASIDSGMLHENKLTL